VLLLYELNCLVQEISERMKALIFQMSLVVTWTHSYLVCTCLYLSSLQYDVMSVDFDRYLLLQFHCFLLYCHCLLLRACLHSVGGRTSDALWRLLSSVTLTYVPRNSPRGSTQLRASSVTSH